MAMAPEQIGIGIRRYFTQAGYPSVRHRGVGAARRPHHQLQGRHRRLPPARRRVPARLVAERHEHRRPEVLPRHARHARARDVAAAGDRPRRRHDHRVGRARRLLRRRAGRRRVPQRAQVHPRHPARRVQLAGVVQHRRAGRAAAGERVFHPLRRRHDGRDPQLVPRGRRHLQGRLRRRHQPVEHPVVAGAPRRRRHRQWPGVASCAAPTRRPARSSRVARPAAPPRWSSSTSTTPTSRSSSGARPTRSARRACCATPASTWTSTAPTATPSSTRTRTTRCGSPTSSCRRSSTMTTGRCTPSPPATSSARSSARDLMHQISQAAWECADPGMQYDTTINRWHTAPNTGRINGSQPVLRVHAPRQLGVQPRQHQPAASTSTTTATSTSRRSRHTVEVDVHRAGDPRRQRRLPDRDDRRDEPRAFRQLGLGYANLGALLMAQGLPYDSDEGRAWAAAITSLMTGHAYATSARTAGRMGPFAGYAENADADAQRAAHAPGRGRQDRRGARAAGAAVARRSGRGTRPSKLGETPRRAQLAGQRFGSDGMPRRRNARADRARPGAARLARRSDRRPVAAARHRRADRRGVRDGRRSST